MSDYPLQPTIVRSPEVGLDTADFRQMIYAHPASQIIRYFQTSLDPSYNIQGPTAGTLYSKWLRSEVDVSMYMALVQNATRARHFIPGIGDVGQGDLVITVLPDQIPLADHDIVIPCGRTVTGNTPSSTVFTNREVIRRGSTLLPQSGIVSSTTSVVTGVGTTFTSTLMPGDIMAVGSQQLRVVSIASDTTLTLESSPVPVFRGNVWAKAVDRLTYPPVAWIDTVAITGYSYVPGPSSDVWFSADQQYVQWFSASNSPAPGVQYSITYRYQPMYEVREDLGLRIRPSTTTDMPQGVVARLWKPETSATGQNIL